MATDPAVQAAAEAIHAAIHTHSHLDCFGATDSDQQIAEAMLIAVTPLIRAQAFTEAADKIEARANGFLTGKNKRHAAAPLTDFGRGYEMARHQFAALVRGLGEETENA